MPRRELRRQRSWKRSRKRSTVCRQAASPFFHLKLDLEQNQRNLLQPLETELRVQGLTQGEAGQGLSDSVRKYRQSVFKLNYKIKKNSGRTPAAKAVAQPAIPATAAARMAAASSSAGCKADLGPSDEQQKQPCLLSKLKDASATELISMITCTSTYF